MTAFRSSAAHPRPREVSCDVLRRDGADMGPARLPGPGPLPQAAPPGAATPHPQTDLRAFFGTYTKAWCEPTTHRLLLKVSRPPPHHSPECRPGPTLSAPAGVGSSLRCPTRASPGSDA